MTKLFRNLPIGCRVAIYIWAVANLITLGLFIVGPDSYRTWFITYGFCLEQLAFWTLFVIGANEWRNR